MSSAQRSIRIRWERGPRRGISSFHLSETHLYISCGMAVFFKDVFKVLIFFFLNKIPPFLIIIFRIYDKNLFFLSKDLHLILKQVSAGPTSGPRTQRRGHRRRFWMTSPEAADQSCPTSDASPPRHPDADFCNLNYFLVTYLTLSIINSCFLLAFFKLYIRKLKHCFLFGKCI